MAFGARKIFPIDTKPGTAIGVSLPFNAPAVFNSTYTTAEALRNNLINYFLTDPPERYLNPTFGGGLRRFVFEQLNNDTFEEIEIYIRQEMSSNFPALTINSLIINPSNSENSINIGIQYIINNTGINGEIQLEFI